MKLAMPKKLPKPKYSYDPRKDGVSQSMIASWLTCREKARLNIVLGWSSPSISKPLIYGSIMHGTLELGYRLMRERKCKKFDDLYDNLVNWLEISYKDWVAENPNATTQSQDVAEEACAIILEVLPRYWKHWLKEDLSVEWVHVEDQFNVPLQMRNAETVPMVGQFDGTFYDSKKRLCLFETKNKSQFPERLSELLPLDLQLGYYLTALEEVEKVTARSVRYNLIRRPGERRGHTENLQAYAARIGKNVDKKPDHYFQRLDIDLDKTEKDTHKFRAQKLVEEFYFWWRTHDHKNRDLMWNSGACEGKYGVCGNLAICANQDYTSHHIREHASPELVAKKALH